MTTGVLCPTPGCGCVTGNAGDPCGRCKDSPGRGTLLHAAARTLTAWWTGGDIRAGGWAGQDREAQ
jgi:hypothetical protein